MKRPMLGGSAALTLLFAILCTPLSARQTADSTPHRPPGYLAPEHWSRGALQRLAGLGLLHPAEATLAWPAPRRFIRELLLRARANQNVSNDARALAESFLRRFDAEFTGHPLDRDWLSSSGWAAGGWRGQQNELFAGSTTPSAEGYDYLGPRIRSDTSRFTFSAGATFEILRRFWLGAETSYEGPFRELLLTVPLGPAYVWAGRRTLSFGPADEDGVVLSGNVAFDGLGVDLPGGFVLPGFLRHVGRVRITQMLARMDRTGDIMHPWFLAQRVTMAPHPRLSVGFNRAAIFGGRGNLGITAWRVFWLLLGQTDVPGKQSDFENQVASVEVVWRPGPMLLYIEYGFDDAGAAFRRVPGVVLGAEAAAIPYLPWLALGAEFIRFEESCCKYPPWYWHGALPDGWSDRGDLLGHALAGNGSEVALTWRADLESLSATVGGRFYWRRREAENLFAPDHQGQSTGAALRATLPIVRPFELRFESEAEDGASWDRWNARALIVITR